jgi:hypothetical protein
MKGKSLSFTSFYFSESRLFRGLQPKKNKKFSSLSICAARLQAGAFQTAATFSPRPAAVKRGSILFIGIFMAYVSDSVKTMFLPAARPAPIAPPAPAPAPGGRGRPRSKFPRASRRRRRANRRARVSTRLATRNTSVTRRSSNPNAPGTYLPITFTTMNR